MLNNYDEFEKKYLSEHDNLFDAVLSLAEESREVSDKFKTKLSTNECLTYCISSKLPNNLNARRSVIDVEKSYPGLVCDKVLADVDDVEVKRCVESSIKASCRAGHLKYNMSEGLSTYQKERVLILCRMINDMLGLKG